ncbi:hypothetical protein [Rhodopseudomonas sp. RCAM05734]|uniref:hypothetical protein n=1 Tax=Rhodopseudomonas sp. RCAM05734 TaxID=3457549 RepID=UPI004043DC90
MSLIATLLDPPWKVATPIGDAECHVIYDHGIDHPARYHCSIDATGEFWTFTQPEIRRNTNITEGRTRLTPFSAEIMARFAPMRAAIERLERRRQARER